MIARHQQILTDMLTLPTAPFVERYVLDYLERFCAKRPALTTRSDRHGNLLVSLRRGRRTQSAPITLAAHLDHPGFVAERMTGNGVLGAAWRGGVLADYFPGGRVRFFVDGRWVRGRIKTVHKVKGEPSRVERVEVTVAEPIPRGTPGMWDLPDPRVRGRRIGARACDDLAGAAGMLCALDALCRRRGAVAIDCLFTRAEEIGFIGAIAACRSGLLARNARVIAVECSSELPGAKMGQGPILRVGDSATVFSATLTATCRNVADALGRSNRSFRYQRKLMDGGACETTAYRAYGRESTGICLALGNYHNMNRRTGKIASEYIDLDDFDLLVRWFIALATTGTPSRKDASTTLRQRIDANYRRLKRYL